MTLARIEVDTMNAIRTIAKNSNRMIELKERELELKEYELKLKEKELQAQSKSWRDAGKEPPEEELVVLSDKHELVFKWKGEWFRTHIGVKGSETTVRAWMPLPEYYAEEEQVNERD